MTAGTLPRFGSWTHVVVVFALATGAVSAASVADALPLREDGLKYRRSGYDHGVVDERRTGPLRSRGEVSFAPESAKQGPLVVERPVAVLSDKMIFEAYPQTLFASEGATVSLASVGAGVFFGVILTSGALATLVACGTLTISFPRKQEFAHRPPVKAAETNPSIATSGDEPGVRDHDSQDFMSRDGGAADEFVPRLAVLVSLLALQSLSSYILADFGFLIAKHPHLIYFLTMLVGLGGNAGGQSVVLAVRRIALGLNCKIFQQTQVAVMMAMVLGPASYMRAALQGCSHLMAFTIGLSAAVITLVSVGCGTVLPSILKYLGFDPAHAAPMIQVAMDMIGISIVCILGTILLGGTSADL